MVKLTSIFLVINVHVIGLPRCVPFRLNVKYFAFDQLKLIGYLLIVMRSG